MINFNIYFSLLQKYKEKFNNSKNKFEVTEQFISEWNSINNKKID